MQLCRGSVPHETCLAGLVKSGLEKQLDPVEVDQLLINMLLVWNSNKAGEVDQHVDHLINFVDQLLINMLIS